MAEHIEDDGKKQKYVVYCGACTLPTEYCCYGSTSQQQLCKEWSKTYLADTVDLPEELRSLELNTEIDENKRIDSSQRKDEEPKKEDSTAAKNKLRKKSNSEPMVKIGRTNRNRRKYITIVGGLADFPNIKMKDAAKAMGKQFACGCSVNKTPSGAEEVIIQGDVLHELPQFLLSKYNIPSTNITIVGE